MICGVMKSKSFYRIVKSDRINALRKQYDAFIEEDKKRKERNDYILGRLDKMRYSTSVVPVRYKSTTLMNRPLPVYQLGYLPEVSMDVQPSVITKNQLLTDIPVPKIDDTYLIQEISKNYILIPKHRSPLMNNYIQATPVPNTDMMHDSQRTNTSKPTIEKTNSNENIDWKSKYEILNILKKEEKEKQSVQFADEFTKPGAISNKDIPLSNMYEKVPAYCDTEIITDMKPDAICKYIDDLPEKDISDNKVNFELKTKEVLENTILPVPAAQINIDNTDQLLAASVDTVADIDSKLQNANLDYNYSTTNDAYPSSENANYAEHEDYNYKEPNDTKPETFTEHEEYNYTEPNITKPEGANDAEYHAPIADVNAMPETNSETQNAENIDNAYVENEGELAFRPEALAESGDPEKVVYVDEQDTNPVQVISSNDLMQEINNDSALRDSQSTDDYTGYATENINVQEMTPNVDFQMKGTAEVSPEQHMVQHTSDDVIQDQQPKTEINPEAKDIIADMGESVNTVGIDDFNAEQSEMFSSDDPNVNYGYQQGYPNPYDQGYQQGEVNQDQQEYSYYENTEAQAYPDMGETEEQNTRYDQTYQQQYQDPYEKAYEQQQEEEQPPQSQHYEGLQDYEQSQPEILEQLQDNRVDNVDQVETKLDTEDEYTEQKLNETDAQQSTEPAKVK